MEPMTRSEIFMAAAAGEYDGDLPIPVTREDQYWQKVIRKIEDGNATPEEIDAAIEAYLNSHDADIVTEAELSDALAGKVDKETGKGLTDINYSADEQAKVTAAYEARHTHGNKAVLDGITEAKVRTWDAAQPNVNADWNADSGDARILNKPDLSVYALAANVTKSALGIDSVDNTSDADKPISTAAETALAGKVDKETNKSLMTADEHTKLNGIEAGAQVNVQSDWEQNNSNADDFIKNKPANLVQDASYVHTDNNFTNAEKAKADGAIQSTEKGTAGGVAELDANGKVPTSQLPAYVSDVYEGYLDIKTTGKFYSDAQFQNEIQGQPNKIYVSLDTNLSYRWGGTGFREISPSIALGNTSETAYRGDWGAEDRAAIGTLGSLNTSEKSNLVAAINELQSGSVSVDPDRGLSENDFTDSLKSKLDGIESGAEVNVQSDWNQTVTTADDFIKNKPENLVQDASYVHTDNNYTTAEKTKLGGIESGAEANVQSDWNQSDTTADDYIKNKPTNASASSAGLMSAADFKKINAQGIATNSDLNDIKGEGWYACYTNGTAATLSHCPTTMSFYMEVHKHAGVYQHIVEYSTAGAKHFHRNFYSNVWGDWVEWKLTDTTYSAATTSAAGLMSAADKEKLDGLTRADVLWSGDDAVTSATVTLNRSIAGYDIIEVITQQCSVKSTVTVDTSNNSVCTLWLCVALGFGGGFMKISTTQFIITNNALNRALTARNREIVFNPSGSNLAFTTNEYTNQAHPDFKILKILGYKTGGA